MTHLKVSTILGRSKWKSGHSGFQCFISYWLNCGGRWPWWSYVRHSSSSLILSSQFVRVQPKFYTMPNMELSIWHIVQINNLQCVLVQVCQVMKSGRKHFSLKHYFITIAHIVHSWTKNGGSLLKDHKIKVVEREKLHCCTKLCLHFSWIL